jgi:hypothetical protein
MTTFRVEHKDIPWLMITKPTVEDERLSFRALGALTWLLNKPDDWRFTAESMARGEGREGRDAVRNALRELEALGYIHRKKYQDAGGRWVTESVIYEEAPPGPENPPPKTGSQSSVEQPSEDQGLLQGLIPRTDTKEEDLAPAVRNQRARDEVWDALLVVCGVNPDRVPDSARGKYNRAVADLKKLGATRDEIRQRAQVYRLKWPDVSMTPNALVVHWGECDPQWQHAKVDPKAEAVSAAVFATFERLDRERAEAEADEVERRARVREQNRLELEA